MGLSGRENKEERKGSKRREERTKDMPQARSEAAANQKK